MSLGFSLFFYDELSTLINSGVSVQEALQIMVQHTRNVRVQAVAVAVKGDIIQGKTLSEALAGFDTVFASWQVNIVKYSETSGTLKAGLLKIVTILRADADIRRKLIFGLTYPVILLHLAILLLPLASTAGRFGWPYISQVFMVLIPLYAILLAAYGIRTLLTMFFIEQYSAVILWIPIWGRFVKSLHLTRFLGVLSCLCGAGVNIVQGWKVAAGSCDNVTVATRLLNGLAPIGRGGTLSEAFSATRLFPAKTVSIVTIGEKSGSIDAVLARLEVYAEQENEKALNLFLTAVPIVVYLAVSAYIGQRVIAFYTDYFAKLLPSY